MTNNRASSKATTDRYGAELVEEILHHRVYEKTEARAERRENENQSTTRKRRAIALGWWARSKNRKKKIEKIFKIQITYFLSRKCS